MCDRMTCGASTLSARSITPPDSLKPCLNMRIALTRSSACLAFELLKSRSHEVLLKDELMEKKKNSDTRFQTHHMLKPWTESPEPLPSTPLEPWPRRPRNQLVQLKPPPPPSFFLHRMTIGATQRTGNLCTHFEPLGIEYLFERRRNGVHLKLMLKKIQS